jgi:hypothetical protein
MFVYEIRLLNRDGDTSLVYMTQCRSDEHAMQQLHAIKDFSYSHFEIHRRGIKILEGENASAERATAAP